jgi:hypothetical protein
MNVADLLVVEGPVDQGLFKLLAERAGAAVDVVSPKDSGLPAGGKENVLNTLPSYLKTLGNGGRSTVGVIVDADWQASGTGYATTKSRVIDIVSAQGLSRKPNDSIGGLVFERDERARCRVWISPDNANDGILEDAIRASLEAREAKLFGHSEESTRVVPERRFDVRRKSKAEVLCYLSWQKSPGMGLGTLVADDLLDANSAFVRRMLWWLDDSFG